MKKRNKHDSTSSEIRDHNRCTGLERYIECIVQHPVSKRQRSCSRTARPCRHASAHSRTTQEYVEPCRQTTGIQWRRHTHTHHPLHRHTIKTTTSQYRIEDTSMHTKKLPSQSHTQTHTPAHADYKLTDS